MYAQILLQTFGKKFGAELAPTYFCIQLVTFFTIYTIPFPSNVEIYMDQFRGLISFDIVKPDKVMKFVGVENFDFDKMMGFKNT